MMMPFLEVGEEGGAAGFWGKMMALLLDRREHSGRKCSAGICINRFAPSFILLLTPSYAPDVEPGIRCGLASKIDVFPALMKLKDNKAETHI